MTNDSQKILKIGVTNFKAFNRYTELELHDLTIIAGLNSSGKSTIYQAMLLLAQSDRSFTRDESFNLLPALKLNGQFIELGTPQDILSDSSNKTVEFSLFWNDGSVVRLKYALRKKNKTQLDGIFVLTSFHYSADDCYLSVLLSKGKWSVEAYKVLTFTKYSLAQTITEMISKKVDSNEIDVFNDKVVFRNVRLLDFSIGAPVGFATDIINIEKCIKPKYRKHVDFEKIISLATSEQKKKDLIHFTVSEYADIADHQIRRHYISYIQPFRGYPKRVYASDVNPNPLSRYHRIKYKEVDYKYDSFADDIVCGSVETAMNYWVVDHFELAERIEVKELVPGLVSEIFLTINGKTVTINNVGFGTSQIIPVIFNVLTSDSILFVVDEPEIHLHASIQSKLATFFSEMMSIGKCLLIETHSEYLIDKIIYHNILQENESRMARLYWVKKDKGESVIEQIQHDDLGFILNAPDGFLSEKKRLVKDLNAIRLEKMS